MAKQSSMTWVSYRRAQITPGDQDYIGVQFTKDEKQLHADLFRMISMIAPNDTYIVGILDDEIYTDSIEKIVNQPYNAIKGKETMLMWAVWHRKLKVVKALIDKGANVRFTNKLGEGAHTYFDTRKLTDNEQDMCLDIAIILHKAGANLSVGSTYTKSLTERAKQYSILRGGLGELGYGRGKQWNKFDKY